VPDLPTPAPYNHVVLAVPTGGGYAFIDPSTPYLPTGRLPGALQGQKGLLVRPGSAELIDLPEDKADDNTSALDIDLTLAPDGGYTGQLKATLTGLDAAAARAILASGGDDVTTRMRELLLGGRDAPDAPAGLQFKEVARVAGKSDSPDETLHLQVTLKALKDPASKAGHLIVVPDVLLGRPYAFLWRATRRAPIMLDHRSVARVKLQVHLPEGMGVGELPPTLQRPGPLASVDEQWAIADGVLWLSRTLRIDERIVPADRYDELRVPLAALWGRQQEPVAIIEGGDRGANYRGDPF
jgi:hypothetical protein